MSNKPEEVSIVDLSNVPLEESVSAITKDYGIGIDCHSLFYQVCILKRDKEKVLRYEKTF